MTGFDLKGRVFGRLTAVALLPERKRGRRVWRCQCSCGNEINVRAASLLEGRTQSCGCFQIDVSRGKAFRKYGNRGFKSLSIMDGEFDD